MTRVEAFAQAKINLTLHVTGQRPDGYHLLDSLVVFADVGDRITVSPSKQPSLTISGPMSGGVPSDPSNLVLRAAEVMGVTADIHLEKHLPSAAGLGGGSSDAGAALRALARMTGQPLPELPELLSLGADVPLCLNSCLTRMQGIGDELSNLGQQPDLSLILINPNEAVPTGAVFQLLDRKDFAPMTEPMPALHTAGWIEWLAAQRNDLEAPAIGLAPVIGNALEELHQLEGCLLARMSGSGATCFAIMRNNAARDRAIAQLTKGHPDWWIKSCSTSRPDPR